MKTAKQHNAEVCGVSEPTEKPPILFIRDEKFWESKVNLLERENTQLRAQCDSMLKEQLLRDREITRLRAEIEKTSQSLSTLQRAYLRIEGQRDKLRDEVERLKGQP